MHGINLRFYLNENRWHGKARLYEWIIETAKGLGIHGGTAVRAVAGFGRKGVLHQQSAFEMAKDSSVVVEFILSEDETMRLLEAIDAAHLRVMYVKSPVEYGIRNESNSTTGGS